MRDLSLLSATLGQNLEEAGLVVHIILKDMMYRSDSVKGGHNSLTWHCKLALIAAMISTVPYRPFPPMTLKVILPIILTYYCEVSNSND